MKEAGLSITGMCSRDTKLNPIHHHRGLRETLICLLAIVLGGVIVLTPLQAATPAPLPDARDHLVEFSQKDITARNNATLPSIEQVPRPTTCGTCTDPVDLARRTEPGDGVKSGNGLHRLHREVREAREPHDNGHLVEDAQSRAQTPRR